MDIIEFLDSLVARGFVLTVSEGAILLTPASQLALEDREAIKAAKSALMALLRLREFAAGIQACELSSEEQRYWRELHGYAEWHCAARLTPAGQPTGELLVRRFHAGGGYDPQCARDYAYTPEAALIRDGLLRCADAAERTPAGMPLMLPKAK